MICETSSAAQTFVIRKQICDAGSDSLCTDWANKTLSPDDETPPDEEETGSAPSGYDITFIPDSISQQNQASVSFRFIAAQTGASHAYSIDDTDPATPAIAGTGTVTTPDMIVSGIDLSGLRDGSLTLQATLSANGKTGTPVSAIIMKDATAPSILTLNPPDNASDVWGNSSIALSFDEPVLKGAGTVSIHNISGTLFETFSASSSRISISGNGTTITPTSSFISGTTYYVNMDAGTFTDLAGNPSPAITGSTSWNFTASGTPQPIQTIPTNGAREFTAFSVDGTTYVALANMTNGSTSNINSRLYRFEPSNPDASKLVAIQDIPTKGAAGWEAFTVSGTTYLLVANQIDGTNHSTNSVLYRFEPSNPDASKLVAIQNIPSTGAADWEAFDVGGTTYIVLANHRNSSTTNINSTLYRFEPSNPDSSKLAAIQSIPTNGALDWEAFSVDGTTYLAVANHYNTSSGGYTIPSKLFRFSPENPDSSKLVEIQSFSANGPTDIDSFTYLGETYLVIGNYALSSAAATLYRFEPERPEGSQLVFVQSLTAGGLFDVETFYSNGFAYIATASFTNDHSKIFRLVPENPDGSKLVEIYTINASKPTSWAHFVAGGASYFAVANQNSGSNYNINSHLFRFQP